MPVTLTAECTTLYVHTNADSPPVSSSDRDSRLNHCARHPAHKLLAKLGWDTFYDSLMAEIDAQKWLKLVDDRAENAPYKLCNYKSDRFSAWSEFTILCRGLLIDPKAKRIVATSFPKFWNFHQLSEGIQQHVVAQLKASDDNDNDDNDEERKESISEHAHGVFEKLDGSLGICFWCAYSKQWRICTRGNFASTQALWATKHLGEKLKQHRNSGKKKTTLEKGCSYLFEIIYKANKIGVDYGDFEGLALIAAYNEKGYEFHYESLTRLATDLDLRVTQCYTAQYGDVEALLAAREQIDANQEGFVLCLANGFRVKFKGKEYLNALKTKKYSSPDKLKRRVKAMVLNDGVLERDSVLKEFEDEFYGEVGAAFDEVFADLLKRTTECARDLLRSNSWSKKQLSGYDRNTIASNVSAVETSDGAWSECRSKNQRNKQKKKRGNQLKWAPKKTNSNVRSRGGGVLHNDGKFVLRARKVCGPNVWRSFQGKESTVLLEKAVKRITNELIQEKAWRQFIAK